MRLQSLGKLQRTGGAGFDTGTASFTAVTVVYSGSIVHHNGILRTYLLAFSAKCAFVVFTKDFYGLFALFCGSEKKKIDKF
jgi:hypothetical protein